MQALVEAETDQTIRSVIYTVRKNKRRHTKPLFRSSHLYAFFVHALTLRLPLSLITKGRPARVFKTEYVKNWAEKRAEEMKVTE
jgi:hypothetical protein